MTFERHHIGIDQDIFTQLYQSVQWETFPKGRQIANIHLEFERYGRPLVRTTTVYQNPSQPFSAVHHALITAIRSATGLRVPNLRLNNAMMEIYDSQYKTMRFHTDQALDLADESYICLFSCYEAHHLPRVLVVKAKETGQETTISLLHGSVVIFSTATNSRHAHKIELKDIGSDGGKGGGRWMGVTFRLAKSFVRDDGEGHPALVEAGKEGTVKLWLATDEERKAFCKFKGTENREIDYVWPQVGYTISPSDLIVNRISAV